MAAAPAARRLLVLDGVPGPWLPVGIEVLPQRGQGLAERIAAAFADAYRTRPLPMLLVGMDTPQLTAAAAHLLAPATDAVLGLAAQGNVHRGIDVGHPREVVHPQAGADPSRWFPWASLGLDDAAAVADPAGLRLAVSWQGRSRLVAQ